MPKLVHCYSIAAPQSTHLSTNTDNEHIVTSDQIVQFTTTGLIYDTVRQPERRQNPRRQQNRPYFVQKNIDNSLFGCC